MTSLSRAVLAAFLGLSAFSAARAADYNVAPFAGGDSEVTEQDETYAEPDQLPRTHGNEGHRGWRSEWGADHSYDQPYRNHWGRPIAERRWWRDRQGEDCRIIIKRRVTPWGDVRVRRVEICD